MCQLLTAHIVIPITTETRISKRSQYHFTAATALPDCRLTVTVVISFDASVMNVNYTEDAIRQVPFPRFPHSGKIDLSLFIAGERESTSTRIPIPALLIRN